MMCELNIICLISWPWYALLQCWYCPETFCFFTLIQHIYESDISDGSRWKKKSRQTKAEMARPDQKDDMARNQMTTEMAEDRRHWHVMIRAGTLRSVEVGKLECLQSITICNEFTDLIRSELSVGSGEGSQQTVEEVTDRCRHPHHLYALGVCLEEVLRSSAHQLRHTDRLPTHRHINWNSRGICTDLWY